MFVISLNYKSNFESIELHLQSHRKYLEEYYEKGVFLASGPKNPRNGGVILASGKVSRERLDEILAGDPFHQNDVADYEIIEFTPSKYANALRDLI